MNEFFLLPVKFYRWIFAAKAPTCRYLPTCSEYALDAVREWGPVRGYLLALWRLLRCHPFAQPRLDPVPRRLRP